MKVFKKIAIENNLIMTKGSDYHGPNNNPEIKMGSGKNDNISKNNALRRKIFIFFLLLLSKQDLSCQKKRKITSMA